MAGPSRHPWVVPEGFRVSVTAQGTDAALRDTSAEAMAPDVEIEALTPRNIHGYYTLLLIRRAGGQFGHEQNGADSLTFTVVLP